MLPLEGIKVVELCIWIAGPGCGALLADCGASVIKVEHPESGGDPARGWTLTYVPTKDQANYVFETMNRGKRSLALDLSRDEGRGVMYKLIEEADVFITNLRLPTLDTLKVDYESLRTVNPRLIYARATGFGSRGPDRDSLGYDSIGFWARSGLMMIQCEPEHPPVSLRVSMGDITTATHLFTGIMLALYDRKESGKGHLVDTSLLATGAWVASENTWSPLITGKPIPRISRKNPPNPLSNIYLCSDGRWLYATAIQPDRDWGSFCRAIERNDLLDDPRFSNHAHRTRNSAALVSILDEVMSTRTSDEWGARFDQHHIAWGKAVDSEEMIRDPQMGANGYIVEAEHPVHGRLREIAAPFQLDGESFMPRRAAPALGESTEEVLLELGYDRKEVVRLKEKKVII